MSPESATLGAKRFSSQDLKKIENSENEQKQFKQWVMQSKEFSQDEKNAVQYSTLADFQKYWVKATDAKSKFDSSHEKGHGRWTKRYQSFSTVVQSFMEDISPIVEIIRDFGSPYGGVAVGTISLLFLVARNKDKTEGSLTATISGINDRLPGLKLYQHIYSDDHELDINLQAKIVSAYESFIVFAIAATKYYKIGGPRRFLRALGGPDTLRAQGDEIQNQFLDIRHLCEELLDKNVDTIKRLNIQQAKDIKKLEAQIEQLQITNDNIRLNEIQKLLKLESFSEEQRAQELEKYGRLLHESLDADQFEQMRDERLAVFERCPDYQTWHESPEASILILSGYNERSILDEDQCWLSPIALNQISNISQLKQQQQEDGISSSSSKTTPSIVLAYQLLPQKRETLIHHVIPPLLLQLLRQKRHALRDERAYAELYAEIRAYAELYAEIRAYADLHPNRDSTPNPSSQRGSPQMMSSSSSPTLSASPDSNDHLRVSTLEKIASRVVSFFSEGETVFVIVDRVDRCMDARRDVDHRKALTRCLVRMVEGAGCRLKVLVVINGYDWRIEERRDEFGGEKRERVVVHTERQCRVEVES